MCLNIFQSLPAEYIGGHVLVLNTFVSQNRRGQTIMQVHIPKPLYIQCGNGIIAFPELFQVRFRHFLQNSADFLRVRQKCRQIPNRETVPVEAHFLGR